MTQAAAPPPDSVTTQSLPYSAIMLKQLVAVQRFCTYTEYRVLCAYAARANPYGVAWPTVAQIASDTDLATAHVSAAILSLTMPQLPNAKRPGREPLLKTIGDGGGKGRAAERQLLIQGDRTFTDSVRVSEVANLHEIRERKARQTLTDFGANLHGFCKQTLTKSVKPRRKEEGSKESTATKPEKKTPSPPGDHAVVIAHFCDGWKKLYGVKYVFAQGKDGSHAKSLLAALGREKLCQAIDGYFADREAFVVDNGHSFGLLASRINRYTPRNRPGQAGIDPLLSDDPSPSLKTLTGATS